MSEMQPPTPSSPPVSIQPVIGQSNIEQVLINLQKQVDKLTRLVTGVSDGIGDTAVPAFGSFTSASKVWKDGRTVTLEINVQSTANNGAGAGCAVIPVGFRMIDASNKYFWMQDVGTGAAVPMYMDNSGGVYHVFARSNTQQTVGIVTYVIGS